GRPAGRRDQRCLVHRAVDRRVERHAAQDRLAEVAVGRDAEQTALAVDDERNPLARLGDPLERLADRRTLADEQVFGVHVASRFRVSAGPSSTAPSTRTIRSAACPSPYGFVMPERPSRNAGASAASIPLRISSRSGPTPMTLAGRSRRACRAPTLSTVGAN